MKSNDRYDGEEEEEREEEEVEKGEENCRRGIRLIDDDFKIEGNGATGLLTSATIFKATMGDRQTIIAA